MALISNAAPKELSSPFYEKNKAYCQEYETFIKNLGGSVKGLYNAYSFNVLGLVNDNFKWNLRIKKSTFSSSGSLLLSSKDEILFDASQWSTKNFYVDCPEFIIKRKTGLDFLRIYLSKQWRYLIKFNNYIIKCNDPSNIYITKLNEILSDLYLDNKVFKISNRNSEIFIDLRTDKIHKDEIEKLLKL